MLTRYTVAMSLLASLCGIALGQGNLIVLVTDRQFDSIWRLHDANNNKVIDEPTEVTLWFGAGNASGLPGVLNPNMIMSKFNDCPGASSTPPLVIIGDQDSSARRLYWTMDLNDDGDAMDAGEAGIFADITTGAGQSFAFPTGGIYLNNTIPYVVNGGNNFGPDAIWRCEDMNADNDANDAGETTAFTTVNGFSTSNGSFSPQEIVFGSDGAMYLRNSSSSLHGIWRLNDDDSSGVVDQASEFILWYGAGNASGFTMSAGFAIDADRVRPGAFYYHSIATGGVDQVYRVRDIDNDGDAMDAGESVLVWSTNETGFTSIDVCSLPDGSVLVSDNTGTRIIRLEDIDNDGLFTSAGERFTFYANTLGYLGDLRNIALVEHFKQCGVACDSIDYNNDGLFPDTADIDDFLSVFSGGPCSTAPTPGCNDIDFNNDGLFPDTADIDALLSVFSGGPCL